MTSQQHHHYERFEYSIEYHDSPNLMQCKLTIKKCQNTRRFDERRAHVRGQHESTFQTGRQ